jgi:hypothetical protein
MAITRNVLISIIFAAALVACGGKKDDKSGGGTTGAKTEDKKPAAPAAPAWVQVPTLGVQLEMPGDAKAEPGAGDSFMISGATPDCVVMLGKESPEMADSYEKTLGNIKEAKMGNGKLKAVKKEEKGADGGFKIEWEAESSMDPKETLYGVEHRVVIDGTMYGCSRRTNTAEGQACVAKACASLKKI